MKKYLRQLLFIAVLVIAGCGEDDPCEDVVCGPGKCVGGSCECPEGYEGNACETLEKTKYLGKYTLTSSECSAGTLVNLTIIIANVSGGGVSEVGVLASGTNDSFSLKGTLVNKKLDVTGEGQGTSILKIRGDFTDENNFSGVYETVDVFTCNFTIMR